MTIDADYSPMDVLHKLCDTLHYNLPVYILENTTGLMHKRIYKFSCNILNFKEFGEGTSKIVSKRIAAHKMLLILKQ